MKMSKGERLALQNLADKEAGHAVGWINIAAAQALTALGLARRSREGWEITQEGALLVEKQGRAAPPPPAIALFRPLSPASL